MNKFNITSLQSALEKGRALQEKREESFSGKSDKWQESEKGVVWDFERAKFILDDIYKNVA